VNKLANRVVALTLVFVVIFFMAALAFATARQVLKCYSVPREARQFPLGPMDPHTILHLAIELPGRSQAELERLTQNITDPKSPEYRHFLTPQEYAQRFGASQATYDAVVAFFKSRGFSITPYSNRLLVDVDGPVKLVEAVFHTTLRLYKHPTENRNFYAPDDNPSVDLDIPLSSVAGLDDFILVHPVLSK
jgi:subtilase family serine protease